MDKEITVLAQSILNLWMMMFILYGALSIGIIFLAFSVSSRLKELEKKRRSKHG